MAGALQYLESQRNAQPELADWYNTLADLYQRKLWHQLTLKLEQFVALAVVQAGDALIQLYHNFITDFETKINLLKLAHFAVIVSRQYFEKEAAISYLEGLIEKLRATKESRKEEPVLYVKMQIAAFFLEKGNQKECKNLLEDGKSTLDSMTDVDPSVHASYYWVSSQYHKSCQEFAGFYKDALLYLAYTNAEALSVTFKLDLAFDLSLAALLGDNIYNFGELLAHPIVGVRRETMNICNATWAPQHLLKRVARREPMKSGDVILLPVTVQEFSQEKTDYYLNEDDINYISSLELYKDDAVIAVNKPPGMPVQGGVRIKLSMDILAGTCLRYDYSEPPRLVHRLDRECSGILVLGRTQTSASILHSIFRAKTDGALDEMGTDQRIFTKRYWALVFGKPKHSKGLITTPLMKVVLENGKSERIMVANSEGDTSFQHAVTDYRVIASIHGLTWLELCPLTGRKHQLRVHCAEVLGTPIVGDFKYGWSSHRKWQPLSPYVPTREMMEKCFCSRDCHQLCAMISLKLSVLSWLRHCPHICRKVGMH